MVIFLSPINGNWKKLKMISGELPAQFYELTFEMDEEYKNILYLSGLFISNVGVFPPLCKNFLLLFYNVISRISYFSL